MGDGGRGGGGRGGGVGRSCSSAGGIGFKSLSGLTVFVSGSMQGRNGANRSAR